MKITVENFPETIRDIRKNRNWSRRDLARHLGVSHRAVEHWENGRPPAKYLVPVVNLFLDEMG
jgi:transcriptional regulator with XRE-family HTH domain